MWGWGVGGRREEGEMVHQVGVVYVERSHVAVVGRRRRKRKTRVKRWSSQ